jgi:hypothetical protein
MSTIKKKKKKKKKGHNLWTFTLHTFTKFNVIKIWTSVHYVYNEMYKIHFQ